MPASVGTMPPSRRSTRLSTKDRTGWSGYASTRVGTDYALIRDLRSWSAECDFRRRRMSAGVRSGSNPNFLLAAARRLPTSADIGPGGAVRWSSGAILLSPAHFCPTVTGHQRARRARPAYRAQSQTGCGAAGHQVRLPGGGAARGLDIERGRFPATPLRGAPHLATCRRCCARDCRRHAAQRRPGRRSCRGCREFAAPRHSRFGCASSRITYGPSVSCP
jgi:hypothetical protein